LEGGAKGSSLFQGQFVKGEVFWLPGEELGEFLAPALRGLLGASVDQIDVDVVEVGLAGLIITAAGLVGVMRTSQSAQVLVRERLETKRETVEAKGAKSLEVLEGEGVGVGFKGDLYVRGERERGDQSIEELLDKLQGQQGRGAAAKVERFNAMLAKEGSAVVDLLLERCCVLLQQRRFRERKRIKVAVATLLTTEGEVQIDLQGRGERRHQFEILSLLRPNGG